MRQVRRVSNDSHHIKRKEADTTFGGSGWYSDNVAARPLPNSSAHSKHQHQHQHQHHQGVGALGSTDDALSGLSAAPAAAPEPSGQSREEFLRDRSRKRAQVQQARKANGDPHPGNENLANLLGKLKLNKPEKAYVADTPDETKKGRPFMKKGAGTPRSGPKKATAAAGRIVAKPSPKPAQRTTAAAAANPSPKPARRATTTSNRGGSDGIAQSRKDAAAKSRKSASARLNVKAQAEAKARAPYTKKPQTRGARNSSRVLAPPGGHSSISFM